MASCATALAAFTASHSSAKCPNSPHLRQSILDLSNLPRYFFSPTLLLLEPLPLRFSSATKASHSARVSRFSALATSSCGTISFSRDRPFDDSSNALKRPIVSVTDISSTFPHCSMVLMRGPNLSVTECRSFSTTVMSSTLVPRERISFTIVVTFKAKSLIFSDSFMYIPSSLLLRVCTRAFLTRSSPACISSRAFHTFFAVSTSEMANTMASGTAWTMAARAIWSIFSSTSPLLTTAAHTPCARMKIFIFTAHTP
uniref:Uncharacterized protein n=1 Tax=Setaria viridis TaxID=4556 RepID=A0A4U6UBP0_SETVI|nr:hypothetical protein SEVIR_5G093050v2 [Setaria viridis]